MGKISSRLSGGRLPSARSVVLTAALAASAAALSALSNPAALRIDGQRLLSDVPPVTMVALSTVASAFRTKVNYEPARANIDVMTTDNDVPGAAAETP
jgi:hypothetical protein